MGVAVALTRGAVATGDDPGRSVVDFGDRATVEDLVRWVTGSGFLAQVVGGSTWAVRLGDADDDGAVVAVVERGQGTDAVDRVVITGDAAARLQHGQVAHVRYLLHQDVDATVALVHADPHRRDLRLGGA